MSSTAPARFVRQFALTGGRARSLGVDLPMDALVVRARGAADRTLSAPGEERAIVELCAQPIAIAELAARLHLHLGIVRVLVSDLCERVVLDVTTAKVNPEGPDLATLERLLDDLHAL